MSLDVWLRAKRPTTVHKFNITHNLNDMAQACGLYEVMWRPKEIGVTTAEQAIPFLRSGIKCLTERRDELRALEPDNGWGTWESLFDAATGYLAACQENPDAEIEVWR
jgi:hypothetical protein